MRSDLPAVRLSQNWLCALPACAARDTRVGLYRIAEDAAFPLLYLQRLVRALHR
jgi:hypothetical protein